MFIEAKNFRTKVLRRDENKVYSTEFHKPTNALLYIVKY